jgi:hypothetical protein
MTILRQRMTEDMQVRNLSPHTQACYLRQVSHATSASRRMRWVQSTFVPIRSI